MTGVLVGGVGHLYQGDLDVGRVAVERLGEEDLGPGVVVEELSYGAIAVMLRLEELRPGALVLVGAAERGRAPASVERRPVRDRVPAPAAVQDAAAAAYTGYVTLDLLLDVAAGFGVLPERTVAVEVEPVRTGPSTALTPEVAAALPRMLALVRAEVGRALGRQGAEGSSSSRPSA